MLPVGLVAFQIGPGGTSRAFRQRRLHHRLLRRPHHTRHLRAVVGRVEHPVTDAIVGTVRIEVVQTTVLLEGDGHDSGHDQQSNRRHRHTTERPRPILSAPTFAGLAHPP